MVEEIFSAVSISFTADLQSKSNKVKKIYCIPGNAGTALLAENISIDINNFEKVYEFLKNNNIDFVVVGPEDPLVNGIVVMSYGKILIESKGNPLEF